MALSNLRERIAAEEEDVWLLDHSEVLETVYPDSHEVRLIELSQAVLMESNKDAAWKTISDFKSEAFDLWIDHKCNLVIAGGE